MVIRPERGKLALKRKSKAKKSKREKKKKSKGVILSWQLFGYMPFQLFHTAGLSKIVDRIDINRKVFPQLVSSYSKSLLCSQCNEASQK